MMTRRERLLATFHGKPVDRPPVSFYEIGGWHMEADNDEFNVWNDPSWRPLVRLAEEWTDLIRMVGVDRKGGESWLSSITTTDEWREGDSKFVKTTLRAGSRTLRQVTRRDKDTQTVWTLEHLLKTPADAEAYLRLPEPTSAEMNVSGAIAEEQKLGDMGIICVDSGDPICSSAGLFSMEDYTIVAFSEQKLFHRLLERFERILLPACENVAKALPGRLWRLCGSEYASEPYLPPSLYDEYVVRYTGRMVKAIQQYGGFARIHSHGRLRNILPFMARMKPDGLDPLEPPTQGDMELHEIKAAIGKDTVLMGNLESSDIENLPPAQFEKKVVTALREGTAGPGRGFVLMPSACPYGRTITPKTLANYETMVRLASNWGG